MALQKQPVSINFSGGLDTKTDPNQVSAGKFLSLNNSVFDTLGRLTKRNGYSKLTTLPDTSATSLSTFNGSLVATGQNLYSYDSNNDIWLTQGIVQPVGLSTVSLLKTSASQNAVDSIIAPNGLICFVYNENGTFYYQISDSVTGSQIVNRIQLPNTAVNPRTYVLGAYFIIVFGATVTSNPALQYVAIPIGAPSAPLAAATISTDFIAADNAHDEYMYTDPASGNSVLFMAWHGSASDVNVAYLGAVSLAVSSVTSVGIANSQCDLISVTVDITQSPAIVWVSYFDSFNQEVGAFALDSNLSIVRSPTVVYSNSGGATAVNRLASTANNQQLIVFQEIPNTYTYSPNATTNYVQKSFCTQTGSVVSNNTIVLRSVGLASKAILFNALSYMLVAYGEPNQPTYFLMNEGGNILMKLAYSNGGGYATTFVVPSISLYNGDYYVPYLDKDFLVSVNKGTAVAGTTPNGLTPTSAIYTQTGINLAKFSLSNSNQYSSNIANDLLLTGGILWSYDGVLPVEQGFNLWPENVAMTTSATGGNIAASTYYYVFTYEWTDNQGNLNRSAPSIPVGIITTGSTSTNTINVPTLRATYKAPVRIVGYRWSTAQQVYYQFTSVTNPTLGNVGIDSVTFVDTLADTSILGNPILYTTGGVIENIGAPASTVSCLFKNRVFLVDAEDQNLLWFSKQVIEAVPIEMSDLLTLYVAPTSGAQGSTGPITALGAMDDKLIIFKRDAIYYVTGTGPDNTGANNDFSDPIFITSSVGSANPNSIVLMPNGLMFQSDKGIWLLGRDLTTLYVGAPVEQYNSQIVKSAATIPATNQVRFILASGVTLMYDYFVGQWGTFSNQYAIAGTLYQNLHTYLNKFGQVYQESIGTYLDGSVPVLMSFTSSWINLAGLQGYERFYFGYLLGTYYSPFKLNVQLSYDYNANHTQSIIVEPDNQSANYGGEQLWGSAGPWGGPGNVFEARFFPEQQKCESFQVAINEVYDPLAAALYNLTPGQGLTLSGMNLVVGAKKGYRTQKAARSFG